MAGLVLLSLFCCLFSLTHGVSIYVAINGTGDGSQASPYGNLTQAFQIASQNSITDIIVGAGTWSTSLRTSGQKLTITGAGSSTILTCGGTASLIALLSSLDNITLSNLSITSCSTNYGALASTNSSSLYLTQVDMSNLGSTLGFGGVYVDGGKLTVRNSVFRNVKGTAILATDSSSIGGTSVMVSSSRFSNNVGSRFYSTGAIYSNAFDAVINVQDSTFISNSQAINITSGNLTVYRNKFFGNSNTSSSFTLICSSSVKVAKDSTNQYCGPYGNQISCASYTSTSNPSLVRFDACGICDGNNTNRDCNGICFGNATNCVHNTYYVSSGGSGNGTIISSPLGKIQDAVDKCGSYGDTIVLLEGTYSGPGNTAINFGGKTIYLRSFYRQPDATIIRCSSAASIFQFSSMESYDTVIEGVTITGCNPSSAFAFNQASATIKNCIVRSNTYSSGPALFASSSFAVLQDSQILNNSAPSGGAVFITESDDQHISDVKIVNTRFAMNNASTHTGGAIYINGQSSRASITGCNFESNAAISGRDIVAAQSGSTAIIVGSSFYSNLASASAINCIDSFSISSSIVCGTSPSYNQCPSLAPIQNTTSIDSCLVCGGTGISQDCNGTCYGFSLPDGKGGCCHPRDVDCAGSCNGNATFDKNQVCCTGIIDCDGVCNGSKIIDATGDACCLRTQFDCSGVCYGNKTNDTLGNCCLPANKDNCSICFGNGSSCISIVTTSRLSMVTSGLASSSSPGSTTMASVSSMTTSLVVSANMTTNITTTTGDLASAADDKPKQILGYSMITFIVALVIIVLVLLAIIIIVVFLVNRRKKAKKQEGTGVEMRTWY